MDYNLNIKNKHKFIQSFFCIFFVLSLVFLPYFSNLFAAEVITITARVGPDPIVTPNDPAGAVLLPVTAVKFSGFAYPQAFVYLLKNGQEQIRVTADNTGAFSMTLPELYDDTILYTLYAIDVDSSKSLLLNYPIVVYIGHLTHLSGIRFVPTVSADKSEVNFADSIRIFGYAMPNENLEVIITKKGTINESSALNNLDKKVFNQVSKPDGSYSIEVPVLGFAKGEYTFYVKYKNETKFSKIIRFNVGDSTKLNTVLENIPGDCNFDGVINLVDFSILAFWYKKPNPPVCVDTNKDGIIDLTDFSILAFYWTG